MKSVAYTQQGFDKRDETLAQKGMGLQSFKGRTGPRRALDLATMLFLAPLVLLLIGVLSMGRLVTRTLGSEDSAQPRAHTIASRLAEADKALG